MTPRTLFLSRPGAVCALAGALLLAATTAQAQTGGGGGEQARVLSSTPITEQGQVTGYSVEYEFAGRRYTTRLPQPPGATLPVQVTALGVSTFPVAPRPPVTVSPLGRTPAADAPSTTPWADVQPQPGVVLSSQGQAYGAAPQARAVYGVQPAPVYAEPYPYAPAYSHAPAYPYPYAYSYPQPSAWAYPPVSLSFNLGYSRGWRGGYGGYGGRGWR